MRCQPVRGTTIRAAQEWDGMSVSIHDPLRVRWCKSLLTVGRNGAEGE
jgi:hypothetical protein